MNRRTLAALLLAGLAIHTSGAAATSEPRAKILAWVPSPGHRQIPLWPNDYPLASPEIDGPESTVTGSKEVAGRPWTAILNVKVPTMTVYDPMGRNTGAAIMVFPGGGYNALAIDLGGVDEFRSEENSLFPS